MDLALNDLQRLICHKKKPKPNQTLSHFKPYKLFEPFSLNLFEPAINSTITETS